MGPPQGCDSRQGILNGKLRFIGATLLHTLASATIGIAIAISFYKKISMRRLYLAGGVALAIALHALFNFFVLKDSGGGVFTIFLFVWIGVIITMLFFERVKHPTKNYC